MTKLVKAGTYTFDPTEVIGYQENHGKLDVYLRGGHKLNMDAQAMKEFFSIKGYWTVLASSVPEA